VEGIGCDIICGTVQAFAWIHWTNTTTTLGYLVYTGETTLVRISGLRTKV
jgi:hypothetical protein